MRKKLKRYNIKRYTKIINNLMMIQINESVDSINRGNRQCRRHGSYNVLDVNSGLCRDSWLVLDVFSIRTHKLLWVETILTT